MEVRRLPESELTHHGIKGQKWGVRRYQNPDGTLTALGEKKLNHKKYNAIRDISATKSTANEAYARWSNRAYRHEQSAMKKGNVKKYMKAVNEQKLANATYKEAKKTFENSLDAVSQYSMRDFKMENKSIKRQRNLNRAYNIVKLSVDIANPLPVDTGSFKTTNKEALRARYREQYLSDKKKYGGSYSAKTKETIDYYNAAKSMGNEKQIAKYEKKVTKAKKKDDKKYGQW